MCLWLLFELRIKCLFKPIRSRDSVSTQLEEKNTTVRLLLGDIDSCQLHRWVWKTQIFSANALLHTGHCCRKSFFLKQRKYQLCALWVQSAEAHLTLTQRRWKCVVWWVSWLHALACISKKNKPKLYFTPSCKDTLHWEYEIVVRHNEHVPDRLPCNLVQKYGAPKGAESYNCGNRLVKG